MTYRSFLHQILYAYVGFPDVASLIWRYDGLPDAPLAYYGELPEIDQQYGDRVAPGGGGDGGDDGGGGGGGECPPCGQTMEEGGCTGVTIDWTAIEDATKYIIQYGQDPRIRGAGQSSVTVSGNPPATTYCLVLGDDIRFGQFIYYRITARVKGSSSVTSGVKSILFCPSPAKEADVDENCCKEADVKIEINGPPNLISGQPAEEYVATHKIKTEDDAGETAYEYVPDSSFSYVVQPENSPAVEHDDVGPLLCELTPIATATTKIELHFCITVKHLLTNKEFVCCDKKEITISGANIGEDHVPSNLVPLRTISFTNSLLSVLSSISRGNTCCGSAGKTGGTITGLTGTTPGTGSVTLYTLSGGTLSAGSTVTVYNISSATIASGTWVLVNRDTLGNWWITVEASC